MNQRQWLRKYRDELKGLAILWIVFSHMWLGLPPGFLAQWQFHGYAGVDIFFFLSGFGLYHSLDRSPALEGYMRRRLGRLLPAYLPFCVLWLCVMLPVYGLTTVPTVRTIFGNLLMVGFFADAPQMISWYVSALFFSILLAPFLATLLKGAKRPGVRLLGMLACALLLGLCFLNTEQIIAVSRLPIFIIGMGFALEPRRELGQGKRRLLCVLSALTGVGLLWLCTTRYAPFLLDFGMYWYPFALIVPPLCLGLGWAFEKLERLRGAFAPLRYLGRASFEVFLFNVWVESYTKNILNLTDSAAYLWWGLGSVAAGCLYHAVVEGIKKRRAKHAIQE